MSNRAADEGWGIQHEGTGYCVVEGPYGDGRRLSTPVLNKSDALALAKLAQDRDDLLEALKAVRVCFDVGADCRCGNVDVPEELVQGVATAIAKAEGK